MDWVVSITALIVLVLTLRKWKYAPICGVIGQIAWFTFAITSKNYGLLPGVIAYTFAYIFSIRKWIREG